MTSLLALHFSYLGLGLALMLLIFGRRPWPLGLRLGCAYFTGLLVHVGVLLAAWSMELPLDGLATTLRMVGLVAGVVAAARLKRIPAPPPIARPDGARRLNLLLWLVLLPPAALISVQLLGMPDVHYDSTAFWNLKAEWILQGEGPDSAAFSDSRRVHASPSHPLYRPLFTYEHYLALGAADDQAAKPGYWIALLAGFGLLGALLSRAVGRTAALAGIALVLWTPIMAGAPIHGSPGSTYVDIPVGLQYAIGLAFLLRAMSTRAALDLFGAAVATASVVLLKNEGVVWCALFLPLGGLALLASHRRRAAAHVAWLGLPLLALVGWKALQSRLTPETLVRSPTPKQIVDLPSVMPRMADAWWQSLLDTGLWGVLGLALLIGTLVGIARNLRRARVLVALIPVGQLCAVLLAVMLLELQKGGFDNWMSHAWDRLMLQLVPSALLLTLVLNAPPPAEAPTEPPAT
jgi:hypothetical protein